MPVPPSFDRWREQGIRSARSSVSFARTVGQRFARGLTIVFPIGATAWVLWWVFVAADELVPTERFLGRQIRGLGVALVVVLALVTGFVATNSWGRLLIRRVEGILLRIPLVRLVFSTFRDFVNAFFGKKRFDKPVLVRLGGGLDAEVIGFITRQNLEAFGILDKVAVYFPQSYNIGGNVLILPCERLTPIDADSALVMSFIVTGGVASIDTPVGAPLPESTPLRPLPGALPPKAVLRHEPA